MATMSPETAPALSFDTWFQQNAIPFSPDLTTGLDTAIDTVVGALGNSVRILGFGEPLHSGEQNLLLRNRFFQRLVEAHGYSAIAVESSFPRARLVDNYIHGRQSASYDDVRESGFGQGFGRLEASRELVDWMRGYNANPARKTTLSFYGFDIPAGAEPGIVSPRQPVLLALDHLAKADPGRAQALRERAEGWLGQDADWENPASYMDPSKSPGLSPAASELRLAMQDLVMELKKRAPEFIAASGREAYFDGLQDAILAGQFLEFHAAMARASETRMTDLLAMRDAIMADNLAAIIERESSRGKVLVFAHNSHLKRGQARLSMGPQIMEWWPAGAHLHEKLGSAYAVIGSALGRCEEIGLSEPEPGTIEALLATAGPAHFVPSPRGLTANQVASVPVRTVAARNPSYIPLIAKILPDFDWIAYLGSDTHARGAWPLRG